MRCLWFNPSNDRHYQIDISKNLFGQWEVIRSWWGQKRDGGVLTVPCESLTECLVEWKKIERLRKYHGYKRIK